MLLNPLKSALEIHRAAVAELESNAAKAAHSQSRLAQCGDLTEEDFTSSRIASECRANIDVCESRSPFLAQKVREKEAVVSVQYKHAVSLWGATVQRLIADLRAQIISALAPFFLDDNRQLQETIKFTNFPAILQVEQAAWSDSYSGQSVVIEAQQFIAHVSRQAEALSIKI